MNIYLYLRHFPPNGDNLNDGLSKAVHGLASGLVACGANVTILCEASATENTSHKTQAGYSIKCFANKIQNRPSFKISARLRDYICEHINSQDIVILNGILHPTIYSLSRLLKKFKIPYIIAPHDPYNPSIFKKKSYLKIPYWYLLERNILRQAKAVQVLDIRHGQWLRQLKVDTQIIATPNGFYPQELNNISQLEWHLNHTTNLYFLGRIDLYNKGLDLLIDAFYKVSQSKDVHLTFQGPDWGDRKFLEEKTVQFSISEKVSFLEPDYNQSPTSLAAKYDIFCIPSRFEGFSLAALEAMVAGRVLLVSEIAGIAPHVEACDCGMVVTPEVSAIEAGLLKLLERRSEWREMGLRGRDYALKNLCWGKIASAALEQYKQLIVSSLEPLQEPKKQLRLGVREK